MTTKYFFLKKEDICSKKQKEDIESKYEKFLKF